MTLIQPVYNKDGNECAKGVSREKAKTRAGQWRRMTDVCEDSLITASDIACAASQCTSGQGCASRVSGLLLLLFHCSSRALDEAAVASQETSQRETGSGTSFTCLSPIDPKLTQSLHFAKIFVIFHARMACSIEKNKSKHETQSQ